MKTRVEIGTQVSRFITSQAPEPRRALRLALRALENERGNIKALEGPLRDYFRLRVSGFRIVFRYEADGRSCRVARCIFAERRDVVYAVFAELLRQKLLSE